VPVLPPARVLLVEDGEINRQLISLILRHAGLDVITAENGQIGVELATHAGFDLILMDMQMPVMDGYMASLRLRQMGLQTPIIALTAHAMKGDEEKCREAGCSGYLSKPIDTDQLLRTVAASLPPTGTWTAAPGPAAPGACVEPPLVSTLPTKDPGFATIVRAFIGDFGIKLEAMHQAWEKKDLEGLRRLAHAVKGTGGSVGFAPISEAAKRLEKAVQSGDGEETEEALAELHHMAARLVAPSADSLVSSDAGQRES
jgi:CheY-like chemotaxis protein/HPt (histidine-containing phosphotransfer) domain-containing protein